MNHLLVVILTVATALPPGTLAILSTSTKELAKANTEFAWSLYDRIAEQIGNGNMFFSPLSISLALGMTYAGANGTTKDQMEDILEFDMAAELGGDINMAFQELFDSLNKQNSNYTLSIANKLFGRKGYQFLEEYLQAVDKYFRAPLEELDFAGDSKGSRTHINDWVAEQTNQKIKDLIPEGKINAQTALVLVNAIYFKGFWLLPFDPEDTETKEFHTIDGEVEDMDMMYIEKNFNYAEVSALDCKMLELPYVGNEVSMYILLPNDKQGLSVLEEKLQDGITDLTNIENNLSSRKVKVTLPKFKLTQDISLSALLEKMGMEELFCSEHADLSGMNGKHDLYVTEVVHKAYVDVNEGGTEAAGATSVIVTLSAALHTYNFKADHPFIFYIKEKETGSVLFVGRLTSSSEDTMPVGAFGLRAADSGSVSTLSGWLSLVGSVLVLLMQ